MKAQIHVRFVVPGFHAWPGAEGKRAYLASRHRHLFHFEVSCEVGHDDREIEFHDLREQAIGLVGGPEFASNSCEALARNLGTALERYHHRAFHVTVWEDNECGASVTCD